MKIDDTKDSAESVMDTDSDAGEQNGKAVDPREGANFQIENSSEHESKEGNEGLEDQKSDVEAGFSPNRPRRIRLQLTKPRPFLVWWDQIGRFRWGHWAQYPGGMDKIFLILAREEGLSVRQTSQAAPGRLQGGRIDEAGIQYRIKLLKHDGYPMDNGTEAAVRRRERRANQALPPRVEETNMIKQMIREGEMAKDIIAAGIITETSDDLYDVRHRVQSLMWNDPKLKRAHLKHWKGKKDEDGDEEGEEDGESDEDSESTDDDHEDNEKDSDDDEGEENDDKKQGREQKDKEKEQDADEEMEEQDEDEKMEEQ